MNKILVTGACGQLGTELTAKLREVHGRETVIATDIISPDSGQKHGPFELLDVTDSVQLTAILKKHRIRGIYHLAARLSAKSEQEIISAWKINVDGLLHLLNAARMNDVRQVFWPSSIAVFGPDRRAGAPQPSSLNPVTLYGISKVAGEHLCTYFNREYGLDVRSLRYPGLLGYKSLPGGGTTDYAVDIFHRALSGESYTCYLKPDTQLPMMYMEDAIKAAVVLMEADQKNLKDRSSYNVSAISFSPEELFKTIKKRIPGLQVDYRPDHRQRIADSWPSSVDDSAARNEWGWKADHKDLQEITDQILKHMPGYIGNNSMKESISNSNSPGG